MTWRGGLTVIVVALALGGCDIDWSGVFLGNGDDNDTTPVEQTDIPGLGTAVSSYGFDTTVDRVDQAVDQPAPALDDTLARVDLAARAASPPSPDDSGLDLRSTMVLRFAQVSRSVPIINADRRAVLDLPATVLVYRDSQGDVGVAFNNTAYRRARYDLAGAGQAVSALGQTLSRMTTSATGNALRASGSAASIDAGEGIVSVTSDADFSTTLSRLDDAIDARNDVRRIGSVDWAALANDSGAMIGDNDDGLRVVFIDAGRPAARLLSAGRNLGLDLPLRIVVSEADDGEVTLYYDRPAYLADRYQISGRDEAVTSLQDMLSALTDRAAAGG